ncbi:hypothetical protein Ancab_013514 [Ancistrocladus abbreviatus]
MSSELLSVQPRELKFTFEVKKQSTCSIELDNKTDQYVAFKVKTTSPKKYCVKPNAGVIKPKATFDFTVVMQAQNLAPPDLQCKDKFLIQSTVVPNGTTEEDITSDMFAKDSGKLIEEKKLKVVLVGQSTSLPVHSDVNQHPSHDASTRKDHVARGVENVHSPQKDEEFRSATPVDALRFTNDVKPTVTEDSDSELRSAKSFESSFVEHEVDVKFTKENTDKLTNEVAELALKLDILESKLAETELSKFQLREERSRAMREKEAVEKELAQIRRHIHAKTVYKGFPLLYVCMVALSSLVFGYHMHG